MLTNVRRVKGLEVAVAGLLKEDDNRHHFAQAQRTCSLPRSSVGGQQVGLPARQRVGAEFVAIVKEA
jgi:hypothetical protein